MVLPRLGTVDPALAAQRPLNAVFAEASGPTNPRLRDALQLALRAELLPPILAVAVLAEALGLLVLAVLLLAVPAQRVLAGRVADFAQAEGPLALHTTPHLASDAILPEYLQLFSVTLHCRDFLLETFLCLQFLQTSFSKHSL